MHFFQGQEMESNLSLVGAFELDVDSVTCFAPSDASSLYTTLELSPRPPRDISFHYATKLPRLSLRTFQSTL